MAEARPAVVRKYLSHEDYEPDSWNVPYVEVPEELRLPVFVGELIPGVSDLKPYSLRNGLPEEIVPYPMSASIPTGYHWVPLNEMNPKNGLLCVDGMIRAHLYWLTKHPIIGMSEAAKRRVAIQLGVLRTVMLVNYDLTWRDIVASERADPPFAVKLNEQGTVDYTLLLAANDPMVPVLTAPLNLTDAEKNLVKLYSRCGRAIPPIHGLNLINEGHHYLSDKSKASFKAFQAVEKQVWVTPEIKEIMAEDIDGLRDVMWHKAGHPVSVHVKESAAQSLEVKRNLENAKLGSAAARLPALETDLRCAETYVKCCDTVNAFWSNFDGGMDVEPLRYRLDVVKRIPRSKTELSPPVDMGNGAMASTRDQAVSLLKETAAKNADKVAMAFGFYCSVLDSNASESGESARDTLKAAFSLQKLKTNHVASFSAGIDTFKNYKALQAAARTQGNMV